VNFTPGVTVFVGRNATNRTSFFQAVMAALGSQNIAIKGDSDNAQVELNFRNETYTRRFRRTDTGISASGNPYLHDSEPADLFAFLLKSNEARRAITIGADLRELIMRPIDTDEIQDEIKRLDEQRKSVEQELSDIKDLKQKLPSLENKQKNIKINIRKKKENLRLKEAEIEDADGNIEQSREERSELEDKLDELHSKRSELEEIRYNLETERESLEALQRERRELETEHENLPEASVGDTQELDIEIRDLRGQKQEKETEVNNLQSIIKFNEEMLNDSASQTFQSLDPSTDSSPTGRLVDSEVACWTCGSHIKQNQIEATIDQLRQRVQEETAEIDRLDSEIEELQSEKAASERAQRERERVKGRLSDLEDEVDHTEENITELKGRKQALTSEIETIEDEVEALENEDYSLVLDLHKEANQLEYELDTLETDLERVQSNISEIEQRIGEESNLKQRREELNGEIEALRTKIDRIEQSAVGEFNEHMNTLLNLLDYDNLERIWAESVTDEVRKGRRKVDETSFELHVVRSSGSGVTYEDTVEHLSESEREVTGLVFALAGYLAHETYEELPFMLLDSLEAIDSARIATLISYLTDYTDYLLVALLPEDAANLPDDYEYITEF
jgi:chromosome segregation ATPase